jgi:hypothetical protein
LDFFFPNQWSLALGIAFALGLLVFAIRVCGIHLTDGRSRYLALGGIAAAVFAPPAGFVDTSQVLIALVGIVAVTIVGAVIEMRPRRWYRPVVFEDVPGQN